MCNREGIDVFFSKQPVPVVESADESVRGPATTVTYTEPDASTGQLELRLSRHRRPPRCRLGPTPTPRTDALSRRQQPLPLSASSPFLLLLLLLFFIVSIRCPKRPRATSDTPTHSATFLSLSVCSRARTRETFVSRTAWQLLGGCRWRELCCSRLAKDRLCYTTPIPSPLP